ncbi:hypothetical protein [Vagococcus hydrophili]|uniref:Uncharacterized protein n=1 Tax=Vagococcus hydrophili TaxID=2714947 RepID=A0A6G8AW56_9ENTE|nr:hypothetical protein [Vagococcus hydrophili]QIL49210.1 hypothetical protein G7082_12270 [Vagococcus hydrophili]
MNETVWFFIAISIVSLFGSLSRFTPNTFWNDTSYFFRKNKEEYLPFTNKLRGKCLLFFGVFNLVLSAFIYLLKISISLPILAAFFIIGLIAIELIVEISWNKKEKNNSNVTNLFLKQIIPFTIIIYTAIVFKAPEWLIISFMIISLLTLGATALFLIKKKIKF